MMNIIIQYSITHCVHY